MASPRFGRISSSSRVLWSDATNFDGFLLVGFSTPIMSLTEFPDIRLGNSGDGEKLPRFFKIPIENGVYSPTAALYYNADLSPRTSRYYGFLYTNDDILVAGPSAAFAVTSDNWTPPTFTATAPTAGAAPTPDEAPLGTTVVPVTSLTLTGNLDAAGFDITGIDNLTATSATIGVLSATTGVISSNLTVVGNLAVGGTTGSVGRITGQAGVTVGGTLTGATTGAFSSNVTVGGTFTVTGATALNTPPTITAGLAGLLEASTGWTIFRAGTAVGDTKFLVGTGGLGTFFQSMETGTSFTTRPLYIQPNGGKVNFGLFAGSRINMTTLTTYANDAAAGAGGLIAGDVYWTATGELRIKL